ncbi:MAG: hypothetical protein ACRD8O_01135 [Bryobacteraceae bacterium]
MRAPSSRRAGYTFAFATPPLRRALNLNEVYPAKRKGAKQERAVVETICATRPQPGKKRSRSKKP